MAPVPRTFIVFRKPGRAWVEGKDTRAQPAWAEHARFMDELHGSGTIVLAGPYEDRTRVLVIVTATSAAEAAAMFDADPWTEMELLEVDGVHAWEAWLAPAGWPA